MKIGSQSGAEKDQYLLECFHDSGAIRTLLDNDYSIVSGRKGTGKTALARYLENKATSYGIDLAYRISVNRIDLTKAEKDDDRLNSILLYLIIKTVQKLLDSNLFESDSIRMWKDFLIENSIQTLPDYQAFIDIKKIAKTDVSIGARIKAYIASCQGSMKTEDVSESQRVNVTNSPVVLINLLRVSLVADKKVVIIIDDISDYLEKSDDDVLTKDVALIRDLLLCLQNYNGDISETGKSLKFVSLVRSDLFTFMEGSSINKLVTDALRLEWDERSFSSLLIRRLPFFQDSLEASLNDPIESIRKAFPDEIFQNVLKQFETNRFQTNFYAYMVAISFNRPRDFLMFCHAMRNRLSSTRAVSFENIESAEIEYSDYFSIEVRDELYIASRILRFAANEEKLNQLIDVLSEKNGFSSSQLKVDLGKYLGEKTSLGQRKIDIFIQQLWWYGILGFQNRRDGIINFHYVVNPLNFISDKIKSYTLYLHRGLWWFAKKRKGS